MINNRVDIGVRVETSNVVMDEINENVMDDMRVIDILSELEDDHPLAYSKLFTLILGKEQKKRLYNHLATETGRVPTEAFNNEATDIFESLKSGKNS